MPDQPLPFRLSRDGIVVQVKVTPNAGADRIDGVEHRSDDNSVLRLRVKAAPEKGRANAAVCALLAGALEMPKSAISVERGATAGLKTLRVAGRSDDLARILSAFLSRLQG